MRLDLVCGQVWDILRSIVLRFLPSDSAYSRRHLPMPLSVVKFELHFLFARCILYYCTASCIQNLSIMYNMCAIDPEPLILRWCVADVPSNCMPVECAASCICSECPSSFERLSSGRWQAKNIKPLTKDWIHYRNSNISLSIQTDDTASACFHSWNSWCLSRVLEEWPTPTAASSSRA